MFHQDRGTKSARNARDELLVGPLNHSCKKGVVLEVYGSMISFLPTLTLMQDWIKSHDKMTTQARSITLRVQVANKQTKVR